MDKKKLIMAGGITLVGIAVASALKGKAEAAPPGEGGDEAESKSALEIKVYNLDGTEVPHNSPYSVVEGGSYYFTVRVRNDSAKLGSPASATFTLQAVAAAGGQNLLSPPVKEWSASFGPGEIKTFRVDFAVPSGLTGSGAIAATILSPAPNVAVIAQISEQLTVTTAAIDYRATVWLE